jgi:hypothetical protein
LSFTITVGDLALLKASRNTTILNGGLPKVR